MKRIGLMGGTFNPIHIGHLLLAEWARESEELDEIWFIPTGCSYMKSGTDVLPARERFKMTCLGIAGTPYMKALDLEVERDGYTYTFETLEELRAEYPAYHFYFIFGADCLFSIERWKYPERIFANSSIIAAIRGDTAMEAMEEKKQELQDRYHANIKLLPFLQMNISSTMIRERVSRHQSIHLLVPDAVISYIEEKGFYVDERK